MTSYGAGAGGFGMSTPVPASFSNTPSSGNTSSWETVRSMMAQLEHLCTTAGDHQTLETLQRSRLDLQDIFGASEVNAKRAIIDLSKSLAAQHASAAELVEPLERLKTQIEALEGKKTAIAAHIGAMQASKDTSDASIKRLLSSTLQYKDMIQALHADQQASVPRTTHFLALYAIITAIRWNYDSPGIQGFIAPPNAHVRPFNFDSNLSPCVLADALWDAVGTAHGF